MNKLSDPPVFFSDDYALARMLELRAQLALLKIGKAMSSKFDQGEELKKIEACMSILAQPFNALISKRLLWNVYGIRVK